MAPKNKKTTTKKNTTKESQFKLGQAVKDSSGKVLGTARFNEYTGAPLTNPVVSSTGIRADNNALNKDIKNLKNAYSRENAILEQQRAALAERRVNEISGIKTEFDIAKDAQEMGHASDFASRATSLITAGGGFLGGTQSQQGVLQNLKSTFDSEKTALVAKREAAILAAENAYEDKDFALARELTRNAKELQGEIYRRQKDFADQTLAITRENRAQTEFDMTMADKKAEVYSLMDDTDFSFVSPEEIAQIDALFFPGYTARLRTINKAIADGKSLKEDIALKNSIQTLINKTPQGQKIRLSDGSVYSGMKKPVGASTSGLISPQLAQQLGVPSLSGKKESDIILSLAFDTPPQWYRDFHKASGLPDGDLSTNWKVFKNFPDISAYAKSATVTGRIQGTNNIWGGITPEAIATALSEYEDEE